MNENQKNWYLEKCHAGEASKAEKNALIEAMGELAYHKAIAELQAQQEQFLKEQPFGKLKVLADFQPNRETQERKTKNKSRLILCLMGPVVALLAVMIVIPQMTDPGIRKKGNATLQIFRQQGEEIELLLDGASAGEGDRLQIAIDLAQPAYIGVFSIDGRKTVTAHYPESGDLKLIEKIGTAFYLPSSFLLDDSPEHETFYLIKSGKKQSFSAILAKTERALNAGLEAEDVLSTFVTVDLETIRLSKDQ